MLIYYIAWAGSHADLQDETGRRSATARVPQEDEGVEKRQTDVSIEKLDLLASSQPQEAQADETFQLSGKIPSSPTFKIWPNTVGIATALWGKRPDGVKRTIVIGTIPPYTQISGYAALLL